MVGKVQFTATDQQMMKVALELAKKGRYTTMPNPRVGCVIAKGLDIVGSGWHQKAGAAHAEIIALEEAGAKARDATAYVTLEPCSYYGKTGPCAKALVSAGVSRVVYAAEDPNPKVSGAGSKILQHAGVEVEMGLLSKETIALNRGFVKRMRQDLPYVTAKMASSLDGRTAMASGESQWITGPLARVKVQALRASSCAIVTGVGTVLQDNPSLSVREKELGQVVERQPMLVIVDSSLRTPIDAKVINEFETLGRRIVIACVDVDSNAEKKLAFEKKGVEVWPLDCKQDGRVSIYQLLKQLAKHEINDVMLESGADLLGGFIQEQLVDELLLFMAPKLMGASAKPLIQLSPQFMSEAINLNIHDIEAIGDDWLLRCTPVIRSELP